MTRLGLTEKINIKEFHARLSAELGLKLRSRIVFPEGLDFNTTNLTFGTSRISPLYRYVSNKKDLSASEKSHLVSPRVKNGTPWKLRY